MNIPGASDGGSTGERSTGSSWQNGIVPRGSTRRFWRMARDSGKSVWQFIHGYAYARWPYAYIGGAIGERKGLRWYRLLFGPFLLKALSPHRWANSYHGKVVPTEAATRLVNIQEEIAEVVPEQVIPFPSARELVLRHPDHLVALDCPCRLSRENPCYPLDVCLIVGEPFASFMLEHHPERSRAISPEQAVTILNEEADRGHVHHAFFKEAMLDRFYAICNCCSCCCGAMTAHRQGTPMLISSGYVARWRPERCRGCKACADACPFGAIAPGSPGSIDAKACMGCGVCVRACPADALSLVLHAEKPAPLEIPA